MKTVTWLCVWISVPLYWPYPYRQLPILHVSKYYVCETEIISMHKRDPQLGHMSIRPNRNPASRVDVISNTSSGFLRKEQGAHLRGAEAAAVH